MKRSMLLPALILMLCAGTITNAQDYKTGLGIRLGGFTSGFSIKHFLNEKGAVEGIAGFGRRSFVLTGLYEHHFPLTGVNGLGLYVGGGGHLGFFGHRSSYLVYKYKNERVYVIEEGHTAFIPGADFIFGIEYKFQGAPFTVGFDLKPFVDFYDGVSGYADGAFNVRYVF
jgi:hypothetical protein